MSCTKRIVEGCLLLVAVILAGHTAAGAEATADFVDLQRQFRRLPIEARRLTGPLFWLHGDESPERLQAYLEKVAEGGNGCFTAESRPHSDWLGPGWYRDLKTCLESAQRLNLDMWIFDEKWWPSGEVGGQVPQQYASKYMETAAEEVQGPRDVRIEVPPHDKRIAVLAGRTVGGRVDGASLVDLSTRVQDGTLVWTAPEGRWRVMTFTWRYSEGRRGRLLVDGASRDAVAWYIRTVYQPHYDHFADAFGKTIRGYFYDEPETYGDWGTEVIPELRRRRADWKRALVAWAFELSDADEQVAAKYLYQDALAEAWGRTLYGGLTDWCHAHHVRSIGHWLEHGREYLDPQKCAGNMFQVQKYSDMGAIDAVFRQFVPGRKDDSTYQTPKLGSSISHAYGQADDLAMVEIFGARGQDLGYPEMKWWTDHMHVSGINFFIPHSFNPRAPYDRDCPPYFYNGGFEPRWPLYRVYADYTSRLSLLLTGGRHVCPVALLYLGNSDHAGAATPPEEMTTALQDALFDCDWIPYDVFEGDMTIPGAELRLREERYRVLIVPAVEVIPYGTLAKARAFLEAGGVVVGYGRLPSKSATLGKTAGDIADLGRTIWGERSEPGLRVCRVNAAGGRSYFLPEKPTSAEIRQVLSGDAGIHSGLEVLAGDTDDWLHVLHRVKAGRDVFFIANQHHDGPTKRFRLRAHAAGVPESWDALRGEIRALRHERRGDGTVDFSLTLEPLESLLLVFSPAGRSLPVRLEPGVKPNVPPLEVKRTRVRFESPTVETQGEGTPLTGCSWVWHAGDPAGVPPCKRYFRGVLRLPDDSPPREAGLRLTADNDFALYVNGEKAGGGSGGYEDWRRASTVDLQAHVHGGRNTLAIEVTNLGDAPNPAGLIGAYRIVLEDGREITGCIDDSWRSSDAEAAGWYASGFDDSLWSPVKEVARYGAGPWQAFDDRRRALTLPPVTEADPFVGRVVLPQNWLRRGLRVYLEADEIPHEAAAAVTINGQYAGGFIGRPFRLDVTDCLDVGENTVGLRPFAPRSVRLVLYPSGTPGSGRGGVRPISSR